MWDSEELSCLLRLQDSEEIQFLWNFHVGEDVCRILRIFFRLGKIQEFLRMFSGELLLGKMWDVLRIFVWNFCLGRCVILRMFSVQLLVGKMRDFEYCLCQTSLLSKMQDSEDIVSVELLLWCCGGMSVVDPGCNNEHASEGLNWVTCLCTYQ